MVGGRARFEGEAGATLIEMLITVVILGTALVGFVGAMYTAVRTSDTHRGSAEAETVLRTSAEHVKATPAADDPNPVGAPWVGCATTYAADLDPDDGFEVTVAGIRYWSATEWVDGCPAATAPQLISLDVRRTDGRAVERVVVVKRSP